MEGGEVHTVTYNTAAQSKVYLYFKDFSTLSPNSNRLLEKISQSNWYNKFLYFAQSTQQNNVKWESKLFCLFM